MHGLPSLCAAIVLSAQWMALQFILTVEQH